jgi:hypothetical protein
MLSTTKSGPTRSERSTERSTDGGIALSAEPLARIEHALRSYGGAVPPQGSMLHHAIGDHVRALRARGALPGSIILEMHRVVRIVVGYSASADVRGAGIEGLIDQVNRWCLDAYYRRE